MVFPIRRGLHEAPCNSWFRTDSYVLESPNHPTGNRDTRLAEIVCSKLLFARVLRRGSKRYYERGRGQVSYGLSGREWELDDDVHTPEVLCHSQAC